MNQGQHEIKDPGRFLIVQYTRMLLQVKSADSPEEQVRQGSQGDDERKAGHEKSDGRAENDNHCHEW